MCMNLSYENLVVAVDVGGVEKCDSGVNGMVDEFDHIGLGLGLAVVSRHAHTTQPLLRYFKAL